MGLWERLERLSSARAQYEENGAVAAGRVAEEALFRAVTERLAGSNWRVWHGVRVPAQGRRRELDLVIASPERIHIVELKNWSGTLAMHGDRVIQIRQNGVDRIDHGRLFDDMDARADALIRWHAQRSSLRPTIETTLVFSNPRLKIDDIVLKKYGHWMASASEFVAGLKPQAVASSREGGSFWALLWGTLEDVDEAAKRSLPPLAPAVEAMCETLDGLGSWDTLLYYGDTVRSGDVKERGEWVEIDGGGRDKIRLYDRTVLDGIEVHVRRSIFSLLAKDDEITLVLRGRGKERWQIKVPPSTTLRFQAPGQKEPEEVPLLRLQGIRFGYQHKQAGRR